MKHITMKHTRRGRQWPSRLIFLPATLFFVLSAQAQTDVILAPIGGGGGTQFVARCPQGRFLAGLDLMGGDDVDSIRPLCVNAYGPAEVGPVVPYSSKFGGDGGSPRQLLCPKDTPIVIWMEVKAEGIDKITVNNLHLGCGLAVTNQKPSWLPTAVFDGPLQESTNGPFGGHMAQRIEDRQDCSPGLVAVGVNGRSGALLDSLGLICGPPKLTKSIGTTREGGLTSPPRPICDMARTARARNSPAAAKLEAQCLEAQRLAAQRREEELMKGAGTTPKTPPINPGGAGPIITAGSNPVIIPNGQDSATTTITWKLGPDYTYCEIYLSVDNGEWTELARSPVDSKPTTIRLGHSYTFRMMVYEGQAGTPKIITALTVTAKH